MKKLLLLAAAAAAILPMTAQADATATGDVTLTATAADTCAIRGISGAGVTSVASAPAALNLGNDAMNQTTALTAATTKNLTLNAFCNYATHNVSLKSARGGLTNNDKIATVGDFNKRIHYTAKITGWNPASAVAEFTTSGDVKTSDPSEDRGTSSVTRATNVVDANLAITTMIPTGLGDNNPLLAGAFSDTLTVKLGAAF